jgi:O-acetyl-ADP-ribose deacetylase (regulator of RNase III)
MAIKSVFVTGLGTGIGRFPSETCAAQMILAYRHFMDHLAKKEVTTSWDEVFQLGLDIDETIRTAAFLS